MNYWEKTAVISNCQQYRYLLTRRWVSKADEDRAFVLWVMLNPSTADADKDDHTVRKVVAFSHAWGFGEMRVVNLFALRTQYPKYLYVAKDPVGPENDQHVVEQARQAAMVVCAWGVHGRYKSRDVEVRQRLHRLNVRTHMLKANDGGQPRHPLYVELRVKPVVF